MFKDVNIFYYFLCVCVIISIATVFLKHPAAEPVMGTSNSEKDEIAARFMRTLGYEVGVRIEIQTIIIPAVFDNTYKNYNALQKEGGFDLTKYRGKKVLRCTYSLPDYSTEVDGVRVNLLFSADTIIGGDIMTVDVDGFMLPLKNANR